MPEDNIEWWDTVEDSLQGLWGMVQNDTIEANLQDYEKLLHIRGIVERRIQEVKDVIIGKVSQG